METDGTSRDLDYLTHLARDSARFVDVLRQTPPETRVPTCPDWDADDLLWHLTEVQWFWGTIVGRRLTAHSDVEALDNGGRPSDRDGLLALFGRASGDMHHNLSTASPDTPAWTWSHEQSVGFTPDPTQTVRVRATDTDRSWLLTLGRFTGTDDDDTAHDEPDLRVAASDSGASDTDQPAAATVSGAAADLDCWLWHRPPAGQVERAGDSSVLERFDQTIAPGLS